MSEAEARLQARALLAGIRKGQKCAPDLPAEMAFEAVADEVFAYYRSHWKPRTLAVNLNYYENNILPWFKGRPIAGITRPEVLEWFESLHAKPASANRSIPVLSVILRQAEEYGYRPEETATLAKTSSATAAALGNASCRRMKSVASLKF